MWPEDAARRPYHGAPVRVAGNGYDLIGKRVADAVLHENGAGGCVTMFAKKLTQGVIAVAKDPVCGMDVEESKAAGTSDYQGTTYYFCSTGCKAAFDREPGRYVLRSGKA